MKMRKMLIILLVAVVAFAFTACSQTAQTTESESATQDASTAAVKESETASVSAAEAGTEEKLKFGEIAHDRSIEWVNYGVQNFEYACQQLGVEPVVIDAQNNMEKVLAGMEDLISQGVNGVSVYSFSPDLDARVAQMARDAGIPVVFENAVPADTVDRDSVTACTYYDIGYAVADYIGKTYPDSKFVYIMGQPGMNITEPYTDGVNAAIKDGAKTTMVDSQPTNWTAEEAMNVTQNVIQAGIEFDVIFANNEQIAQGVIKALDAAGLKGKYPIVATGGSPEGIEMLKSGDLTATMSAPVSFQGMLTAKKLHQLVKGQEVEALTKVPLIPATKDNIDEIVPWDPGQKVIDAIGGLK
jgi:ABC-type sugar transport system substrate-binding protein